MYGRHRGWGGRALARPLAPVLALSLALPLAACAGRRGGRGVEPPGPTAAETAAAVAARDSVAGGGYGAPARRSRPSLVSRVSQPEIERAGTMNLAAFIESRLSGVRVTAERGDVAVTIRGANSFQSAVRALVLIDGTEGSLGSLTLSDIASIEVLKDSAAAIYGVRGANGVLLVTTRKK